MILQSIWQTGTVSLMRTSVTEYDKLYEQLDTEFDEAKRAKIIEQLQQILINDAAVIVHGYYNSSMISDKTVSGANIHTADYYWLTTEIAPAK